MFTHVPQPLRYAEALLTHFASLSRTGREPALQERFVQAVAELSGCELSQLYLLDATHTSLSLAAEWLGGALQRVLPPACRWITTASNCCSSRCARTVR